MSSNEPAAEPARLIVRDDDTSHTLEPGAGVVTIGRDAQAGVRVDDQRISRTHLKVESSDGQWRVIDNSLNGMFVEGVRKSALTVTEPVTVRLSHPIDGPALTFEVTEPSAVDDGPRVDERDDLDVTGSWELGELDSGVVRAGAAAAARRRSLDISQRSLAADGVINAGALIAFEKGRSWPRERTRAKLEQVLQWPAGTIARIRGGRAAPSGDATEILSGDDEMPLIVQAVVAAVDSCSLAVAALPPPEAPNFRDRLRSVLADLRRLEGVATHATRIGPIPASIKALSTVRRYQDELMLLGASAPDAPLGQRLYAARRRANLSVSEIAEVGDVAEDAIVSAESEETLPPDTAEALETLIDQISWS